MKITYGEKEITKNNQSIQLMLIRVTNVGNDAVMKSYYDENDLIGFKVNTGKILKAELINASSNYLKNNITVELKSDHEIRFLPVIIEKKESFVVKVLLLYEIHNNPTIIPVGKIAKSSYIELVNENNLSKGKNFWDTTFGGNLLIHFIRLLTYLLSPIIFMAFYFIVQEKVSVLVYKRQRKSNVAAYTLLNSVPYNRKFEQILESYVDYGIDYLIMILKITKDAHSLEQFLNDVEWEKNRRARRFGEKAKNYFEKRREKRIPVLYSEIEVYDELVELGILRKINTATFLDWESREFISKFVEQVDKKKYVKFNKKIIVEENVD
ncbi:MAG: hypothetical protein HYZ10_02540 [Ignavibacteriales bacterium]|nr:hypothetical protein [Ignavibacteriales bacterium]